MQTCLGTSAEQISYWKPLADKDIRTNNLNLDIDLDETFAERIDSDQTRINSAVESTELRDQTDITLRNRFVGVRTDDAARNSTHCSNT
jgi:hypothetical protein